MLEHHLSSTACTKGYISGCLVERLASEHEGVNSALVRGTCMTLLSWLGCF